MAPRLSPRQRRERAKELAPLRERAFRELDQNPELTGKQLSQMLGVAASTAYTWRKRWERGRPSKGKAPEPAATEEITAEAVADALLKRVVDALTEHEKLLALIRVYKGQVLDLEKALEMAGQEKERILKIHNEQVKERRLTDSKTLRRLAKL